MSGINFVKNLSYYISSFLFLEILFKILTNIHSFNSLFIYTIIFCITISVFFCIISNIFNEKTSYIISKIIVFIFCLIFASQFIYFKIFKTFYTLYSAANASQVIEFWKDIFFILGKNLHFVFLFFIPFFVLIFFKKYIISSNKLSKLEVIFLVLLFFLSQIINSLYIYTSKERRELLLELKNNTNSSTVTAHKLGLLASVNMDIKKFIFNNKAKSKSIETLSQKIEEEENIQKTKNEKKEEKKVEYNMMNINFDELISKEKNATLKQMHSYFKNLSPTEKNDYTGKYKGYNLIFITAESLSPYALNKDLTPTLYKLVNEGYRFTNFYNPIWGVSTTDGEYVACTGLIPKAGIWSFKESSKNYLPFVMGNQFKKLGFKTLAYHNHTYTYYKRNLSHPNMGYIYKGVGNGLDVKKSWPESDLEMMEKTIPEYINSEPFHVYYMTVSGHLRYSFSGNAMSIKNKKFVENLNLSDEAKAYIAAQIELDRALEYLLNKLEEKDLLKRTLIVISPDHYPYGLSEVTIDELAGHKVEKNFELYKSTLIIYTKNIEPKVIDKPCSSLDIIPTISNLLGLEYDSRLLMGTDIFSNSEPLVIFQNKSFITDKGRYDSIQNKFIPNEGVNVDDNYIKRIKNMVDIKFFLSEKILELDYYRKLFN
ncbi:LTA synthase family protein [Caloramator proteoclasticus]|uniref:Sulfatase n=1 Tax=Caloramator proteoclasticus DSM 10124 TaxID=1121262 RepID=A0A1M4T1T6_9CLOT|nr:alkaline phosphatase family protein [Caloramator proteoclasticus]SHE38413.1 Sulfatase [Caloramator proteoclasticus DSM 10124]